MSRNRRQKPAIRVLFAAKLLPSSLTFNQWADGLAVGDQPKLLPSCMKETERSRQV
jgi:hypothetical protein